MTGWWAKTARTCCFGGDDKDFLYGGAGDDLLDGGRKNNNLHDDNDTLDGGSGIDTIDYDATRYGLDIDLALEYAETLNAPASEYSYDVILNFENVIGSDYGDEIYGSIGDNRLEGEDGEDFINGDLGNDTLNGGSDRDIFQFGEVNGTYHHGQDVIEDYETNYDQIDLSETAMFGFRDLTNGGSRYWEDVGNDVVIHTSGEGDTITILNVQIADLSANDFIF